ncbi:Uncharacterised protein [Vibrio cholerae]|nr:Uncharacterised protein [Vibrio cholerae]
MDWAISGEHFFNALHPRAVFTDHHNFSACTELCQQHRE